MRLTETALGLIAHQLDARVITEQPLTLDEMAGLAATLRTVQLCHAAARSVEEAEAVLSPLFAPRAPGSIAPAALPQNVVHLRPPARPTPDGGSAA